MGEEVNGVADGPHNRRSKRSLVLLAAKIRTSEGLFDAKLRNLSQNGALLEAEATPPVNSQLVFERGDTVAPARVAWAAGTRFGIEFLTPIEESEVLVHIGRPAPRAVQKPLRAFRRSGLRDEPLSDVEKKAAHAWANPNGDRQFND